MDELNHFKGDGDDKLFTLYVQDLYDKKLYKEGKVTTPAQLPTKCGVAPQNLPYECYEMQVLKRDIPELKDAFDKYHAKDLTKFTAFFEELVKKRRILCNVKI